MRNSFEPRIVLEKSSLAEQVFFHIKKMILSEELTGGENIPEEKIAQTFGVSRTPIREALRKLEKYGLVRINPRSQAQVIKIGPEEARYIGEVRSELESMATRVLTANAEPKDADALEKIAQECIASIEQGNIGEAFEKDGEFHLEIAKRCGNPYVYNILKTLDAKIQLIRITNCIDPKVVLSDTRMHMEIVKAIRNKDVVLAGESMRKHIGNFIDHNLPSNT